jgi:hypothetical protein
MLAHTSLSLSLSLSVCGSLPPSHPVIRVFLCELES